MAATDNYFGGVTFKEIYSILFSLSVDLSIILLINQ